MEERDDFSFNSKVLPSHFKRLLSKQIYAIFNDKTMSIEPEVDVLLQKFNDTLETQSNVRSSTRNSNELKDNQVNSNELKDSQVNSNELKDSQVNSNELKDSQVSAILRINKQKSYCKDDISAIKQIILKLRNYAPKNNRNIRIFQNIDKIIFNCEKEIENMNVIPCQSIKSIEPLVKVCEDCLVNKLDKLLIENNENRNEIKQNEERIKYLQHYTQNQMKKISNKLRLLGQVGLTFENPEAAEKVDKRAIRQIVDMNYVVNAMNVGFLEKAKNVGFLEKAKK